MEAGDTIGSRKRHCKLSLPGDQSGDDDEPDDGDDDEPDDDDDGGEPDDNCDEKGN